MKRKYFRSLKNSNEMVSDLVGTIVLLAITVVIFSSLFGLVFSYPIQTDPAKATIIGTIEGDDIILEHRGGEALGPETIIPITIAGEKYTPIVQDLLLDSNGDGLWNIGERLVYKFNYSLTNLEADVMAIDIENNNLVLTGSIDIHPECDIGVKITPVHIDDGKTIILKIKATNYRGDINPSNITIKCKLPDSMNYIHDDASQGIYDDVTKTWHIAREKYDNITGTWHADDWLNVSQSANLNLTLELISTPTQLALLIDGSASISDEDWAIMCNGIALAITNGYIPHNGKVELTIIQFGGWSDSRSWAQVELGGPIVLDTTNYLEVADDVKNITQLGGGTPLSCALRLAADIMSGDPNGYLLNTPFAGMASSHSDWPRQVVNIVTDGRPNIIYIHNERYAGYWPGSSKQYDLGQADTVLALAYFESLIEIKEGNDEIDAEAVGLGSQQIYQTWLRDHIVRPQPGYDNWPPTAPGWVRYVNDYTEFANTTIKQFEQIFRPIKITVEIITSTPLDPNTTNNKASTSISIIPQEELSYILG